MELMDGTPAHKQWCNMSMEQKVAFTEQVAGYQAELSTFGKMPQHEFRGIGTLDAQTDVPGLLVSPGFFMGEHLHYDIPRGPFRSSHDWLCTELNIILQHQAAILKTSDDEDDIEDAENALSAAQKLLALVPSVFPSDLEEPEATALYHHDLHLNNILVDDHGKITAVLDWECVSAMPLWMTANLPKFLEGPEREEEPNPDGYLDAKAGQEPPLGGREKNELYYIHQMEYEATQLRKVYIARLKELWPGWPMEESHAEIDMFHAIEQCDGIWAKRVGRWADRMLNGEKIRFDIDNP
ncbi:phosphotransferase enzyme family-domain-containing protein [Cercophora newfieldiana]|uniref:Phosphotransferase enzyme family-domain-containing protein n=1 Tax=Cercophora newfieldiana TaxID=92897 RepID=A0AA39XUU1_9PEZI|nr:phosphotransferase enzyme family-domain-containing protein [Cercophora newfieldiana]